MPSTTLCYLLHLRHTTYYIHTTFPVQVPTRTAWERKKNARRAARPARACGHFGRERDIPELETAHTSQPPSCPRRRSPRRPVYGRVHEYDYEEFILIKTLGSRGQVCMRLGQPTLFIICHLQPPKGNLFCVSMQRSTRLSSASNRNGTVSGLASSYARLRCHASRQTLHVYVVC